MSAPGIVEVAQEDRADMMELAARIEAADGPSRELDAQIAEALGMCQHRNKTRSGYQDDTGFDCDDCGADSWGNRSKDGHNRRLNDPNPAYTASLDSAMTLVPEGWSVSVGDLRGYDPPMWRCHLRDHRPESLTAAGHSEIWKEGSTPASAALAICAAALRARAQGEER